MSPRIPVTSGSAYPLLALRDAEALASRARLRRAVKRDVGLNAFERAVAALKSERNEP